MAEEAEATCATKSATSGCAFRSANQHVDRGRVLRQSGDVGGAINEFARALQIDPGNQAAAQELELTQKPPAPAGQPPGRRDHGGVNNKALSNAGPEAQVLVPGVDEETPHQREVRKDIESLSAPPQLQPVSNDPITLHMVEDTKNIYQAIGKAAGLNVIFDPKYNSTRIPVDLTNVSLFDALRIVGTLSKTFWRPVTPNTIYVARGQSEQPQRAGRAGGADVLPDERLPAERRERDSDCAAQPAGSRGRSCIWSPARMRLCCAHRRMSWFSRRRSSTTWTARSLRSWWMWRCWR